jgi:hypothetical protein
MTLYDEGSDDGSSCGDRSAEPRWYPRYKSRAWYRLQDGDSRAGARSVGTMLARGRALYDQKQ